MGDMYVNRSSSDTDGNGTYIITIPLKNHIAKKGPSTTPSHRWMKAKSFIDQTILERSRDANLISSRCPKKQLIRVNKARIVLPKVEHI